MKIMAYTFRTFPKIDSLTSHFASVHILGKLKTDLEAMQGDILKSQPEYVIGFASNKRESRIEPVAVNRFGRNKAIVQNEEYSLELYTPWDVGSLEISKQPTFAFCNWTMYKLQYFLNQNKLSTKLIFLHINPMDVDNLDELTATLTQS